MNLYDDYKLAPPQAEAPGKRFGTRRVDVRVKSRRVVAANRSVTDKRHDLRRQRGIPTSPVDSEPIRAHIETLIRYGMTSSMVAAAAGCSSDTIDNIIDRKYPRVARPVAFNITRVTFRPQPEQRRVLSVGARRRLRALQAIGWSLREISKRLEADPSMIHKVGTAPTMSYARWAQIADLYDQLSGTPGPSKQAIASAEKSRAPSPLAWEGVDIDDPRANPRRDAEEGTAGVDEVLIARILRGDYTGDIPTPERKAVIDHAIEHGWTKHRVAQVLNLKPATADQALIRRRRELRKTEETAA